MTNLLKVYCQRIIIPADLLYKAANPPMFLGSNVLKKFSACKVLCYTVCYDLTATDVDIVK